MVQEAVRKVSSKVPLQARIPVNEEVIAPMVLNQVRYEGVSRVLAVPPAPLGDLGHVDVARLV